jgi:hypothetical protein
MDYGIGILIYKQCNLGDWHQSAAALYVWWKYTKSVLTFKEFLETTIRTKKIGDRHVYWLERNHMSAHPAPSECSKIVIFCNAFWGEPIEETGVLDFPFPPFIHPLFVSFHLNNDAMLSPAGITYFKKYAPIGCRDISTYDRFQKENIPCYFSGCMTTLLNVHDPMLGFEHRIDYSGSHVFVDATLSFNDPTKMYVSMTQRGVFSMDPVFMIQSVQRIYDLCTADKITTSRLHVWLPLSANNAQVELWNLVHNRPFRSGDSDFFSWPLRTANRYSGLFEVVNSEKDYAQKKQDLWNDAINRIKMIETF